MTKFLRKRFLILCVVGLAFLMLGTVTTARSAELSFGFKLSGGVGYLLNGGGDLEKSRLGYETYATDWVETFYTSTFDWKKVSILPDFRVEAMLRIGPNFGVALGTGYLGLTSKGNYSLFYDVEDYPVWWGTYTEHEDWTYGHTYKLTAIPLSLNFYYFMPMTGVNLYFFAGPSVYFGTLNHDFTFDHTYEYSDNSWYYWNEAQDYTYNLTGTEKTTCTGFGFQGGIGLEIPFSPNFSFGIEAYGRYAGFSNWEGTYNESYHGENAYWHELYGWWYDYTWSGSDSENGFLYDYEWQWGYNNRWYNEMYVYQNQPSGSDLRNVRKASINLNSVGVMASIIIHF